MADKKIYVVGDIHGCANTFISMLDYVIKLQKTDDLYLLGDYIDRGPRSKEVIDTILGLIHDGYSVFPVMGNHEKLLVDSLYTYNYFKTWLLNGASQTLQSFRVDHSVALEAKYKRFFYSLEYYYIVGNFIIVHGGLNFDQEFPLTDKEAMVWQRNTEIDLVKTEGRRLIVGHTPVTLDRIRESLQTPKIMLDGGCVYKRKMKELGNLVALELNSMELFVKENIDM